MTAAAPAAAQPAQEDPADAELTMVNHTSNGEMEVEIAPPDVADKETPTEQVSNSNMPNKSPIEVPISAASL